MEWNWHYFVAEIWALFVFKNVLVHGFLGTFASYWIVTFDSTIWFHTGVLRIPYIPPRNHRAHTNRFRQDLEAIEYGYRAHNCSFYILRSSAGERFNHTSYFLFTLSVLDSFIFNLFYLGLKDPLTSEDAPLSLASPAGNLTLSSFDQLQKHGQIRCDKFGNLQHLFL